MTMYLIVHQLKNRQIKIGHGCFYPLANDRATSQSCHFDKKTRYFGADPTMQQTIERKIFIKIRLKKLSLYVTRIISKTYFQIKFSSCVSKSAQKLTEISRRSDACNVSSIKVNLDIFLSRSCFKPML